MPWLRRDKPKDLLQETVSDAHLIERLKRGDEHAFLQLYDLHRASIYRFLMHMTGSLALAEELTQEVFVTILDSICAGTIGRFDPQRGTLEGYLLGIARNFARAEHRRTHRLVPLDSVLETSECDQLLEGFVQKVQAWDVASLLAIRSELKILYGAILELPAHYREAVVLCGLQERSYCDAAAILQCSEGTIASRMNRAKALLEAKLRRSAHSKTSLATVPGRKEGRDVRTRIKASGE